MVVHDVDCWSCDNCRVCVPCAKMMNYCCDKSTMAALGGYSSAGYGPEKKVFLARSNILVMEGILCNFQYFARRGYCIVCKGWVSIAGECSL